MKRILLVGDVERYRQGERCETYVIPINHDLKLQYMKLIIQTYIDMMHWSYTTIIVNDHLCGRCEELSKHWFQDVEYHVKNKLLDF